MSSQAINTRTITTEDRRLKLGNSQAGRTISIPSTWSKLRIAMRFAMDPNGTTSNISGTPRLHFGLCSGKTNMIGDATPDHFFGMRTRSSAWGYQAGGGNPYYNSVHNDCRTLLNVDGTATEGGGSLISTLSEVLTANPASIRNAFILEFTKGTSPVTTWTMQLVAPGGTVAGTTDVTAAALTTALETSTMSDVATSLSYTAGTGRTQTGVDEATNGTLDTICVAWDRTTQLIEICDILYARIS